MISIIINIIIIIAIMIIKRLLHLIIAAQQNDQFWKFIGSQLKCLEKKNR